MLHTASFYDPLHWEGQRYRVSRAHPRGMRAQWETAPFLYPPGELLRAYRSGALDFAALTRQYVRGLDAAYGRLDEFREWAHGLPALGNVTLLCFERGEKPCHRRVAARWLLERVPGLQRGNLR
jgi:uncharacterized protein YeaO (DUF488 family)